MKNIIGLFLRIFLSGCVIPFVISVMVYQGFSTNYTTDVFSRRGFEKQYADGIYKYRILGKALLLKTHDILTDHDIPNIVSTDSLELLDKNGDPKFYSAYFYLNTFFLSLTSILLFFVLGGHKNKDFVMVDLPLFCMCLLMAITQYAIVPYDTLSYFFLAAAALLIIYDDQRWWNTVALVVVIVLATLTRETASLILAFFVAINYKSIFTKPKSFRINQTQIKLLISVFCFLCTYAFLRYVFGYDNAVYQRVRIQANINSFYAIWSMLFFISIAVIVLVTQGATREIMVFFAAAAPYILPIPIIANPWEIRLWTPVILLVLILKVNARQKSIRAEP